MNSGRRVRPSGMPPALTLAARRGIGRLLRLATERLRFQRAGRRKDPLRRIAYL